MIERQIHLSSGGGAALQGYDVLLRFGYTKTGASTPCGWKPTASGRA